MDKRTVYGRITEGKIRCLTDRQCREPQCEDCTEFVLADPAEYAELEKQAARADNAERNVRHILFLLKLACRDEESTMSCFPDHCHSCEISKWITKHELEAVKNPLAKVGGQRG